MVREKEFNKNRVRRFNIIFVCICLIGFMFILITIALDNGFEKSNEAYNVYREIQKYINKNETEIYLNEVKLVKEDEKKKIFEMFKGKDYDTNPIQYYVNGDINKMQEVQVKLKIFNEEKIIKIYQNFTCFKNSKNGEYVDKNGDYCDMSIIMKLNYKDNEKTFGFYGTDEAMEILKKYLK